MDLNYEISTWDSPPLATIITLIHDILEAARKSSSRTYDVQIIASRAIVKIQKLKLKPKMEYTIKTMIKPIILNMMCWYKHEVIAMHGDSVRPVMTPYGTLDEARSVRAFVSSDAPISWRFQMACDYCLEDEIFKIGKQLSSKETRPYYERLVGDGSWSVMDPNNSPALQDFWIRIYKGRFDVQKGLNDLSQFNCSRAYLLAHNITAKMYFLEKASKEIIQRIINKSDPFRNRHLVSPPFIAKLFRFIDENQLKSSMGIFFRSMLIELVQWPYQHLFLQAAEKLVDGLGEEEYFKVVEAIMQAVENGLKDHKYMNLFVGFWKMGTEQKSQLLLNPHHFRSLMRFVFLMRNEKLTSLIFDDIPDSNKEAFLFNFDNNCPCLLILRQGQYKAFEILVRVCRLKDINLFKKARRFLENPPPHLLPEEFLKFMLTEFAPKSA